MNGQRFVGFLLLIGGILLFMTPFYGVDLGPWRLVIAVAAAVAGTTLLLRGGQVRI